MFSPHSCGFFYDLDFAILYMHVKGSTQAGEIISFHSILILVTSLMKFPVVSFLMKLIPHNCIFNIFLSSSTRKEGGVLDVSISSQTPPLSTADTCKQRSLMLT